MKSKFVRPLEHLLKNAKVLKFQEVESVMFDGKKTLEKQRMVYSALKELMAGNSAPIHVIDNREILNSSQLM